jgi:tetratricopeptide (TPR) repeat protein
MKKSAVVLVLFCGAIAGAIVYLNQTKSPVPPVAPAVNSTSDQPASAVSENVTEPLVPAPVTNAPASVSAAVLVIATTKPDDAAEAIHKAVDNLLFAKNGLEKHNLFQQLIKSGQIDTAIAELKQRAMDNPSDPEIPTTLGEALLNKIRQLHESGNVDTDEMGILAMQADQSFNSALKIDPANYEAQLVKSISQTFWPVNPARDGQVVQTLSGLIDRQETMPVQPDFAQACLYLGNEYQKIGQMEKALATWQLGLQKFPNNSDLRSKVSAQ